ncbi:hypothetical protein A9G28_05175 [Gilliamella sp. Fer1-1]|jgi:hypothetical protein|uniref:hypothetical protein n=1 Tax=unclassified Gilliamella TaxID=2685620 RepID=UPI00080DC67A|nr:hypothetical protein [Gilliamella apicola]OCG14591.1 hypothetical protein A9G47_03465 [Gilliamella apicola]OCG29204.1 hypothetical protein A9G45_04995 [Gilliamella apicola]OCG30194.1 hypothetical protein A9G46_12040 [Gilliamella apicola]OCG38889.1 hypothetical protein A9G29_01100 [Gilliamella apicola]OCG42529.1 hypothetical protein A9G28_05175 [Gilliamella apicola]
MNIKILNYDRDLNQVNDNVDVEVFLDNGKRYAATFFTIENIISILNKYKETKECCNGLYFWASDMIIVESLNDKVINKTIQDLIKNEEFHHVFSLLE